MFSKSCVDKRFEIFQLSGTSQIVPRYNRLEFAVARADDWLEKSYRFVKFVRKSKSGTIFWIGGVLEDQVNVYAGIYHRKVSRILKCAVVIDTGCVSKDRLLSITVNMKFKVLVPASDYCL